MDTFLNLIKSHAAQLDQGWAQPRVGTVTSVDPATYTARVTIEPEGLLSGWLPISSVWVGNGWGFVCAPATGDQVIVVWHEGDAEQGLIVARLWSQRCTPPQAPGGELWLIHSTGASIKLQNDGTIESAATTWTHRGDLRVTGDVYDSHGPVSGLRNHYNMHLHPPSTVTPEPTD